MFIGKKWKVEADSLNVTLSQRKKRINKETRESYEAWEVVGYFATVKEALRELINQKVRDTQLKELRAVTEAIDELHKLLDRIPQTLTAIGEGIKDNT